MLNLRPATESDIDLVYEWQCRPETRKFARNPEPPKYEEHVNWMKKKLLQEDSFFYILNDNEDIGVVRLDPSPYSKEGKEVSIFISPDFFGKGYATQALNALRDKHPEFEIHAYVEEENEASHKLFLKCNYVYNGKYYVNEAKSS